MYVEQLTEADGQIHREAFVSWYVEWLFGDQEEDEEEEDDDDEAKPASAAHGFGDLGKVQAGQWKCPTCSINNPESADECLACGTANPTKPAPSGATAAPGTHSGTNLILRRRKE